MRHRPFAVVACAVLAVGACSSSGPEADQAAPTTSTTTRAQSTPTSPSVTTARPITTRSAGCAARRAVPTGQSDHTIVADGVERHYLLDVPADYDGTKPFAIVFGLHALTVSYQFVPSMTGFDQGARYQFIGVAPSGRLAGTTPYWDAAPTEHNYDVDFIVQLLDHLEATLCVNPARVFSTGMSNGAQMSSLLACRLSDRITAIAPVSGEEYLAPCNGSPVPILAFHGTADPILPYTGGGLNATQIAATYHFRGKAPPGLPRPLGVDASMRRWAAHNGCDPQPIEERVAPHIVRRTWTHCRAETVLYVVEGGGHTWPGKPVPQFEPVFGPGTTEIDATELMFDLFFGRGSR
jgi:polyhydroxybutyrate depolymerase